MIKEKYFIHTLSEGQDLFLCHVQSRLSTFNFSLQKTELVFFCLVKSSDFLKGKWNHPSNIFIRFTSILIAWSCRVSLWNLIQSSSSLFLLNICLFISLSHSDSTPGSETLKHQSKYPGDWIIFYQKAEWILEEEELFDMIISFVT